MFDPEKEVPSLELCKRLKELGYLQDGDGWYWLKYKVQRTGEKSDWILAYYIGAGVNYSLEIYQRFFIPQEGRIISLFEEYDSFEYIKAPTVAEMGEWLPPVLNLKEGDAYLNIDRPEENLWILSYCLRDSFIYPIAVDGETEANARAKMLIWLIEDGHVSFKEEK